MQKMYPRPTTALRNLQRQQQSALPLVRLLQNRAYDVNHNCTFVWWNLSAGSKSEIAFCVQPVIVMSQTTAGPARDASLRALLGAEQIKRLEQARVLVVGAGGIGCELRQ